MRKTSLFALGLLCVLRVATAAEFYVSPAGNDAGAGSATAPFASVAGARDTIRRLNAAGGLPAGGVTVWLRGGHYPQAETLVFDGRDAGTVERTITYASFPGEQARLTGARALNPLWFSIVTSESAIWSRLDAGARGQVYAVNLRAHGIADLGTLKPRGFVLRDTAPLELFINGLPQTLGRWPNRGAPLARTVAAPSSAQITYAGSRPERWTQARDVWMHGLWAQTWADYHVSVASIDPVSKTVTFAAGPAQFGTAADRPYYAYNLLEEIDEPGEYYVDRTSGMLYVWPSAPLAGAEILASMLEAAVVRFDGARHITLRDLVIEASRGPLLTVDHGDHIRIENSTLRNAGQFAAHLAGSDNTLDHCTIQDCGEEGVRLSGGDRASLTAGNNTVSHTAIRRIAAVGWTYKPALSFEGGCGNVASHNLIEDLPHSAVLFTGNNHLIEANEITRVCLTTSDAGAIYAGHDWGFRGNVIRGNFIHHIDSSLEGYGAHGVYLDDCVSGVEVTANIFYRVSGTAIFCGGGRDTIIRNNLAALCGVAHHNDDRGRFRITDAPGDYWNLRERLGYDGVQYQSASWSVAYPACAAIPNSWDQIMRGLWRNPEGCVFSGNAGWANATWLSEQNDSGTGVFALYASLANNDASIPALFTEGASLDRGQRAAALTAPVAGFQPIAFSAIGPSVYVDTAAGPAPFTPVPTPAPTPSPTANGVLRIEVESPLDIVNDIGGNGVIGVSKGNLDSGQSVRLYDAGDTVRVTFTLAAGTYRIGVRTRADDFWPNGYLFKLDGAVLPAVGDPTTLSAFDSAYGGEHWGTMVSAPVVLGAGTHNVEVIANTSWAVVDYVQVAPAVAVTTPPMIVPNPAPVPAPTPAPAPIVQPTLTVPADISVESTGTTGAVVTFSPAARDSAGRSLAVTSTPSSGATFPLGTTTVLAIATDGAGNTVTRTFTVTVRPPAPLAPTALTATGGDGVVRLAWNPSAWATGYIVRRAPSEGAPYVTVAEAVTTPDFTDTNVTNGTAYRYVVAARSGQIASADSSPASATPSAPAPAAIAWTSRDVGAVNLPGRASIAGEVFTVAGSGADIWDATVGFHYLYRRLAGDGAITARVTGLGFTDGWAKAGVMIRETLDADAPYAGLFLTPANGVAFQWRPAAGAACSSRGAGSGAPAWLRLTRKGDTLTALTSDDGATWRELASAVIPMGGTLYVGLAVTSHRGDALAEATFDSVSVDAAAAPVEDTPAGDSLIPGETTRIEAETSLSVAYDAGINGTVGVSKGVLDSGSSVRLYDIGDAIRVLVSVPTTGIYRLAVRVRSGGTTGAEAFWPAGYRFKLDGRALTLVGDSATVSALDPAYGGCHWGTMTGDAAELTAGLHTLEIEAAANWAVADYVELTPLIPKR
jgi:hypothetical protein